MSENTIHTCAMTHAGGRTANEDAIFCGKIFAGDGMTSPVPCDFPFGEIPFVAVADGMGGHGNGAFASMKVLEWLVTNPPSSSENWTKAVCEAHCQLQILAAGDPTIGEPGTTLAALAFTDKGLACVHVGDSRIYRVEGHYLSQLTRDDSPFRRRADEAGYHEDYALNANVLNKAIGGPVRNRGATPEIRSLGLSYGRFFLCTDGVTDTLELSDLECVICRQDTPFIVGTALAEGILSAKSCDNYSFIIIDIPPDN